VGQAAGVGVLGSAAICLLAYVLTWGLTRWLA
jgi:hypothetical protein